MTLPKLSEASAIVRTPDAGMPAPDNGMVSDGSKGLVARILPLAAPGVTGAKAPLKVKPCPAARIRGSVTPETRNPGPPTFPIDTVWVEVPGLLMVSGKVNEEPTLTLPNARLEGVAVSPQSETPFPC